MPFCSNCGKPYQVGVKFCPECGNAISPNVQTSTPEQSVANQGPPQQAPVASAPQEKILGIIPNVKKMKLTGQDTYAVVVTERRMILAQLTGEMLKQAAKEAQEKGKAEGKGFLDRWGDQLKATFTYSQKYWNIPQKIR